ncbi:MAG: hypothetical protein K0R78_2593 [Pelosinus sp.]|jgi:hypothetical protein|nr:hypothetical protein [Pelosinus sp.]
MNIKNLHALYGEREKKKKIKIEEYKKNKETGHNDVLITVSNQKIWVDVHDIILYRDQGSVFCWKDYKEGIYIELNESNSVCPECGWWICNHCSSCYCNKS